VVAGEWKWLHKEEHYDLYSSPNIIRVIKSEMNEMDGSCGTNGGEGFSVGKYLNKKFGSPRGRWRDNIEIDV